MTERYGEIESGRLIRNRCVSRCILLLHRKYYWTRQTIETLRGDDESATSE